MELKCINLDFSICKVADYSMVNPDSEFCFTGRTDEECSLVCPTSIVPSNAFAREDGWRAFRIQGTLDLSLIGILAGIANVLAQNQIGLFAVSTFNTDYILIRKAHFQRALDVLRESGYQICD